MNNALAAFYNDIAAADVAVQAHVRACRAWNKSDRSEAFPNMAEGLDTAVLGNVSCTLSPAPQSSRTNASRKNWKVDGKRVSQAVAVMALTAAVEALEAQEAVVIEGETISAASAIVQAARAVAVSNLGFLDAAQRALVETLDGAQLEVAQEAYDVGGAVLRDSLLDTMAGHGPAAQQAALNQRLRAIRQRRNGEAKEALEIAALGTNWLTR